MKQTILAEKEKPVIYTEPYNKIGDREQWIRLSSGCPNNCPFCYEPQEKKIYPIPEIVRNQVKIMDMNLLSFPESLNYISQLGEKKVNNKVVYYELICGIDWRIVTEDQAKALKKYRFINIRLAWDFSFKDQMKIKDCINLLIKVGYNPKKITVFMICNWFTSFEDNIRKLDLCKVWNVKVADCYFDNQLSPNIIPIHWTIRQIKEFRRRCRKHNQIVLFGIDPEEKGR